jgi:hypothetical protein
MAKYQGIIIDRAHTDMLQEAINAAQDRARVRTICAEDIIDTCDSVQKKLDISQTALEGVQITVDRHAQKFPAAYNGRPESTIFRAVYAGRKWRLLDVYRDNTRRPGHGTSIVLTDTAKSAVLAAACEY